MLTPTIHRSSKTCGGTIRSRTVISITFIVSPKPIASTSSVHIGFSGARDLSLSASRHPTAAGARAWTISLKIWAISIRPNFRLATTTCPSFPGNETVSHESSRSRSTPSARGCSSRRALEDPAIIADYFRRVVATKLDAGELTVIYGHPERRLGRMPAVLAALAEATRGQPLLWRATFTELARWWRWRAERRWLAFQREDHRLEIQFDEWDAEYTFALEIHRGRFHCSLPVTGPRMSLGLTGLAYERGDSSVTSVDAPTFSRRGINVKRAVRTAIDWETVTPLEQIPRSSVSNRLKRGLRWWKHKRMGVTT